MNNFFFALLLIIKNKQMEKLAQNPDEEDVGMIVIQSAAEYFQEQ